MREYQHGEFCNDVNCEIRLKLNEAKPDSSEYKKLKLICKNKCKKTAYEFHDWLTEHGFKILLQE
jgi:hypothetical protein